jgi:pantothenate kinase
MAALIGSSILDDTISMLAKRVESLLVKFSDQPNRRIMIALAGVPGSGKSTVSAMLLERLRQHAVGGVEVVPMVSLRKHRVVLCAIDTV